MLPGRKEELLALYTYGSCPYVLSCLFTQPCRPHTTLEYRQHAPLIHHPFLHTHSHLRPPSPASSSVHLITHSLLVHLPTQSSLISHLHFLRAGALLCSELHSRTVLAHSRRLARVNIASGHLPICLLLQLIHPSLSNVCLLFTLSIYLSTYRVESI